MNTSKPTNFKPAQKIEGGALLEEWPHVDSRNASSSSKGKKVDFSTYSHVKIYRMNAGCESKKSYTSSDRKSFQLQAVRDAANIKLLIESCPYEGVHAIRYLIMNKIIQREDLVGIEGLIRGAEKVANDRKAHTAYVLKAQKELQKKNDNNLDLKLARISSSRSYKSFERALLRAALAA